MICQDVGRCSGKEYPSQEYLNAALEYDPHTGAFKWKARPPHHFVEGRYCQRWNTRFSGKRAGCNADKSVMVRIGNAGFTAHRIAWIMTYGSAPRDMMIDHINGNPWDNRLCNLRLATASQNMWNMGAHKRNTSGYKGVSLDKRTGRWIATIQAGLKAEHLGIFATADLAHAAYCDRANSLHGTFAKTQ